ncbi:MAG TPA: RelA/SpoT family protein [Candidatus Paceibacterota bacterium]|jgi:GTP pyrophosphokinase|nr:hypothetical protein [Parcubacteria group bacterium]MDP6119507.1 RelA/SpoT family protein [Candidatus Paceibacterota bacterium]HJN63069.1 RelA/SpoT family protein [Candidatus Paceibacterota bacterium]|tara:strand:+ start:6792 stop:8210 length:1419 start_codon:yes stop_codon:yes gene_type:complete
MSEATEIIGLIPYPTKLDIELVEKACDFAQKAHEGQKRYSGDDFFSHVFETAKNIAFYKMGSTAIAAGLLHDSIEDGCATKEEIREEFGEEILFLIEGVTKLGTLKYKGVKRHVESLRRFFLATSEDIRVIVIKLTDRLHNMQTLEYIPEEKQERIAQETLEIYAPLAYRLGMSKLSRELEDLAFKFIEPEEYEKVIKIIKERKKSDIEYLEKTTKSLKKAMAKEEIRVINTHHRVKGIKSLHKKLQRKDIEDSIHDILALRVIVPTIDDCYKTLGIIHGSWRPVPGRIKDFIALPKANGYRSLHTTVFTGDGGIAEIQIRTEKMHQEAEYGVAAHAKYKGKGKDDMPKVVKDINDYQKDTTDEKNFIKDIKQDFLGERIFVLTPNGDVIDLPEGSGPIDFAYAVHSDIGNYISGVKVNGKMGSLEKNLKSGDIVEVMTKKTLSPTPKWLKLIKTNVAKRHIKGILDNAERK